MEALMVQQSSLKKMIMVIQSQILSKVAGISHFAHTFGKGMNTTIIHPAMGK